MTPTTFPQANCVFGPPPGLDESQCASIPAFRGRFSGGCMDGADVVIVAWHPSPEEIQAITEGDLIYLGFMSSMPPHFVTTQFPPTGPTERNAPLA